MDNQDNEIKNLKNSNKELKTRIKSLEYIVRKIYCRDCLINNVCMDCRIDLCTNCSELILDVQKNKYITVCFICNNKRKRKHEKELDEIHE